MYLPKSKYKGNQYTTNNEYIIPGQPTGYTGFYFTTYDGKAYTGTKPSPTSVRLEKMLLEAKDNSPGTLPYNLASNTYDKLRNSTAELELRKTSEITTYYPKPTEEDYKEGVLKRYFVKDKHTGRVQEISRTAYRSLKAKNPEYFYPKYDIVEVQWSLIDAQTNIYEVKAKSFYIPELVNYLKDPLQFVK